ncbi:hypothetical protein Leryth_012104 [Lithospermum erythrorhizon]|nr:hypothetical protein Leryth_012104 [Lithospermum erythrorhizon]
MGLKMEGNQESSCIKKLNISVREDPSVFPGFRFSPTDEELISYYLKKKIEGTDTSVDVISMIEIWKFEPWDLPAKALIQSENEWFFFSPLGRKYPKGSQSKRATETGYWKATGKERSVKSGNSLIGTKRTLVFHRGRAPKGQRTEWIMHEFCMTGKSEDTLVVCRLRKNCEFHINDNSRKRPVNKRKPVDNFAMSAAVEQIGWLDQVGDCGSKEGSCSLNSHYTEQTDSGHESDDKMHSKLTQHNIMLQKSEEDCFADIMKDDIIKLDDSSSSFGMDSELLPAVVHECKMKINLKRPAQATTSHVVPSQGTANRRVRLNKLNEEDPQPEHLVGEQNYPAQGNNASISQRFFKGSLWQTKHLVVYWCLALVIILLLSINLLKGVRQLKGFAYLSLS